MTEMTRKEFLQIGAALPLALHSLKLHAAEKPKTPPRRVVFICNSLGFYPPYFFPKKRGDLTTSHYLANLKTLEKLTVFENFFHPGMDTSNHDSEKSFLTGKPQPEKPNFVNDMSLDQLFARHIGNDTRFPWLSFGLYNRGWGCSWNSRGAAIPPMFDEMKIFNKLFVKEDLASRKHRIQSDKDVLACLRRDLRTLNEGGGDVGKREMYRTVVGELETQLKHEEFWLTAKKPVVENSLSNDLQFPFSTKIHNLYQLAKLALQTDSARVIAISLDFINGAIKVPGVTGGWHALSHHQNKPEKIRQLSLIETDIVKHLDRFLSELDGIQDGSGTLLDHTTVLIGSNMGNASGHRQNNLPTIIAGGGYRHETHVPLDNPTPLCNLFLELLNNHNIDVGQFGSSQRVMGMLKS